MESDRLRVGVLEHDLVVSTADEDLRDDIAEAGEHLIAGGVEDHPVEGHVNDAGFWLVKEYSGLSVGQTVKTWSVMETIISVVAGAVVLLLSLVI